jgi:flagellar motor switch protein FliM
MAKKLRRYRFKGVQSLSREQVKIINGLHAYLPQTPFEVGFKEKLLAALEPLLRADFDYWWEGTRYLDRGELRDTVRNPLSLAIIGLPPREEKILVDFDLTLAQRFVDGMLGGAAEDVDSQRELSDIEDGVLSFLLLKILSTVDDEYETEERVGLRLEKLIRLTSAHPFPALMQEEWMCITLKVFFDIHVGYCRIFLPHSLLTEMAHAPVPDDGPALDRLLHWKQERLHRVSATRADLTVQAGQLSLAAPDLEQLESGDIILLENTDVSMVSGVLEGQVEIRFGQGKHGVIHGTLMVGESGKYEVSVDQILALEEPDTGGHIRDEGDYMEEENSDKLADIDLNQSKRIEEHLRQDRVRRVTTGAFYSQGIDNGPDMEQDHEHSDDELMDESQDSFDDDLDGMDQGEDPPTAESTGMLNDVNVPMVVEIGRVRVSAADVVGLRPGHVIELSRSPGDQVDLVVSGKRIGKGELVEIEGELGVRILSLI